MPKFKVILISVEYSEAILEVNTESEEDAVQQAIEDAVDEDYERYDANVFAKSVLNIEPVISYCRMHMNVIELPEIPGVSSNYDICKFRWRCWCSKIGMSSENGPIRPYECSRCKCCEVM